MSWQNEFENRIKQKVEDDTFTSEDIVISMEKDGFEFPEERRQIGPLIKGLKDGGWIKKDSFSIAERPKVHQANIQVWRRTNKE
jgi:hypothetical protein